LVGKDYATFDDFIEACRERGSSLYARGVLGKIYSIEQLKSLADYCHLNRAQVLEAAETDQENGHGQPRRGISRRYVFAEGITELCALDEIGAALARQDHEYYFSALTYLHLPEMTRSSIDQILDRLRTDYDMGDSNFKALFNGLTDPPGVSCDLESILIRNDENMISLLFSCSRILLLPDGRHGSFGDFFLARVPILVRLMFSHGLVEMSMPTFSDVAGLGPGWSNTTPERYQTIVTTLLAQLRSMISVELIAVKFKKVTLFLETQLEATDMGWRIEPQPEATFDFTQGALPLRRILEALSNSLNDECRRRGLPLPLDGKNLYNVFRALKEQSYTYSLLLQGPLGRSGGSVRSSTLYGKPNTGYLPIMLLEKNDSFISDKLREAVRRSQIEEIENPYDLDLIFQANDV
jgi:hypothetical protein